ncbi:MAG: triose-phosphate isomerase [Candidatus Pelagibacter sp.]
MTNNNMYFIANWKMYGNIADINKSKSLIKLASLKKYKKHKIVYCPPYTLLKYFYDKIKNSNISIGAQNCHSNSNYAPFTGSVNSKLIKSTGAKYVILGHSENRRNGESDLLINKKIHSAINENLKVIFCVGEKLSEKKKKITYKVLKKQLNKGLKNVKKFENIIIAYEPIWSIGTGIVPKNFELIKNINSIKKILFEKKKPSNLKILYGGSVSPNNAKELAQIKEINGFLVGGASLKAKKFIDIIKKSTN